MKTSPGPNGTEGAAPTLRHIHLEDEGWPETYGIRADLADPVVAVAQGDQRAMLFAMTGQSNSAGGGAGSFPIGARAVTTAAPYPHRAFILGGTPLHYGKTEIDPDTITDLAPAAESRHRETPVTSAMRWCLTQDLARGVKPAVQIGETHGYDGRKLAQISKGGIPYANGLTAWRKAAELAAIYAQPGIWCPVLHLDQGEADRPGTSREQWRRLAATFQADNEADLRAITRQPEPVWLALAQTAAAPGTHADAWTALAQQDAMMANARTTIAFPSYFFKDDRAGPTGIHYGMHGVHFAPAGHALRGEYHAKASRIIRAAMAAAADPWALTIATVRTCLRPDHARVSRAGAVITIPLLLPADGKRVEIDTTTLPAAPNYGIVKTAGSGGAIVSVVLAGHAIEVTLAHAGGATLQYAYAAQGSPTAPDRSGAWGNFRDDGAADSIAVPGLKLHNWLVTFELVVE